MVLRKRRRSTFTATSRRSPCFADGQLVGKADSIAGAERAIYEFDGEWLAADFVSLTLVTTAMRLTVPLR